MRLSDLLKLEAFDASGRSLGRVKDVRLERREDAWEVTALIVGTSGVAERLGFAYGVVERPAALASVMRWLARHARIAPWERVTVHHGVLTVDGTRDDLEHPRSGHD